MCSCATAAAALNCEETLTKLARGIVEASVIAPFVAVSPESTPQKKTTETMDRVQFSQPEIWARDPTSILAFELLLRLRGISLPGEHEVPSSLVLSLIASHLDCTVDLEGAQRTTLPVLPLPLPPPAASVVKIRTDKVAFFSAAEPRTPLDQLQHLIHTAQVCNEDADLAAMRRLLAALLTDMAMPCDTSVPSFHHAHTSPNGAPTAEMKCVWRWAEDYAIRCRCWKHEEVEEACSSNSTPDFIECMVQVGATLVSQRQSSVSGGTADASRVVDGDITRVHLVDWWLLSAVCIIFSDGGADAALRFLTSSRGVALCALFAPSVASWRVTKPLTERSSVWSQPASSC